MFAVGDRVLYRGYGVLPKNIPLVVKRVVNEFMYVNEHNARYNTKSFVKTELNADKLSLMDELTQKVAKTNGTCAYALEFGNGNRRFQAPDVCHARMPFGYYGEDGYGGLKSVALNISMHIRNSDKPEDMVRMYDYIIFRSPWKNAFIRPADGKVPVNSGVYINIEESFSYCVAAAIALRSVSEFKDKRDMFIRMLNLGIDEHIAFIASTCATTSGNVKIFENFTGGHHTINFSLADPSRLYSFFFKGVRNYKDAPYKDSSKNMYRIWDVIGLNSHAKLFDNITKNIPEEYYNVKEAWGYKVKTLKSDDDQVVYRFCHNLMKEMMK